MDALVELELGRVVVDPPHSGGEYDLTIVESARLLGDERSVIELDYGGEGRFEFNHENDEEALLARQLTFTDMAE